ncbi:hypothetical protein [Hymenobacter elongatus]|uniref:Uncharacterized protein n=1 Tax=Hymenobacter elongatus TaxID=877208 RepID=A0A4Z0PHS5_9BACT|nr:hypothetical protein [Hymenobacter elongatus]TGE13109.1 hypothetical protein E5J99_19560 [Hymenobacter elongatus]
MQQRKKPRRCALSLPKTQTPFQPCGWKGVFVRLTIWFTAFQAWSANKKGLGITSGKPEKDLGKDKAMCRGFAESLVKKL